MHHDAVKNITGVQREALYDTAALCRRDRAVLRQVEELLRSHERLRAAPVTAAVRGGVVHVRGTVANGEERRLLRSTLARVRGVQAVWDLLNVPGQRELRLIDLGCGKKKQVPWAVGVDGHPYEGVDVVADLEKTLPFGDGEIDVVFASHVLEHVRDLFGLMNEIHRILAPGGALHALVPNARCVNAVANPTHVRFFNTQSFKFFCQEYPGLKLFRPGCVSADQDTVYADLYPVREGETAPADEELAYFFD